MTILPSQLLVRMAALLAVVALLAVPLPILVAPTLAIMAIVMVLAGIDWLAARNEVAPSLERVIPDRLVKGRPATIIYRLAPRPPQARRSGAATTISVLDELPADLGGDLIINDVRLAVGHSIEIARERVPARRGTRELGPTYILWRSRMGLFRLRSKLPGGGSIAILPLASTPQRQSGLSHRSLRDELGIRPRAGRGEGP